MTDPQHAALVAAVDALVNDTLWTEKGHFVEEQRWARCHYWLGGTAATGAAVAAATIVAKELPVL